MRPAEMRLVNFMSFRDTVIRFDAGRLIVFVGLNGAGKSVIASEALSYALYGKARLGADDLVHWGETDMSVTLTFDHADRRYRIVRERTTKAGGKGRLYLFTGQPDGSWQSATRETMADTQAEIERVLRLGYKTFRSSVLMGQGEMHRFAEAPAGVGDDKDPGRARIFEQIVVDPAIKRIGDRAREEARTLDASVGILRHRLDGLSEALADLRTHEEAAAHWQGELDTIGSAQAMAMTARDEAEATLRDLAGSIATAEAAVADVARLKADLDDRFQRHERTMADQTRAETRITRATATLEREPDVQAAIAHLPGLRARVEAGEAAEAQLRQRERELADWRERERVARQAYQRLASAWEQQRAGLTSRSATLEEALRGLRPCPKCGTPQDGDGLADQLRVTRTAIRDLGPEPTVPADLMKAENQARLVEEKIRDLAFDADALARERRDLGDSQRVADMADAMAGAHQDLEDARQSLRSAREEIAVVRAAGKAAREALTAAQERASAVAGLLDQRQAQQAVVAAAREALGTLDVKRSEALAALATARSRVADLEGVAEEHETLTVSLDTALAGMRKLREVADASGVKGVPARIISSVLPEFEAHANALLAELRPDLRLVVSAQREKKSGDGVIETLDLVVVRNGVAHPYESYSGGQRTSISLALALGLSRLAAGRAGAAFGYQVVDEPDGLDGPSRRAFGQALRQLVHSRALERASLVTHHEDLAEYADVAYRLVETPRGSVLQSDDDDAVEPIRDAA